MENKNNKKPLKNIGKSFTVRYGESTGIFLDGNELRIGREPLGYHVVMSTGAGEFPIQYEVDEKGNNVIHETFADAQARVNALAKEQEELLMPPPEA